MSISPDAELEGLRGSENNYVKLRGLPYSTTAEDIIKFFDDLQDDIATQGVHMVLDASVSAACAKLMLDTIVIIINLAPCGGEVTVLIVCVYMPVCVSVL